MIPDPPGGTGRPGWRPAPSSPSSYGRPGVRDAFWLYVNRPLPYLLAALPVGLLTMAAGRLDTDLPAFVIAEAVATTLSAMVGALISAMGRDAADGAEPSVRRAIAAMRPRLAPLTVASFVLRGAPFAVYSLLLAWFLSPVADGAADPLAALPPAGLLVGTAVMVAVVVLLVVIALRLPYVEQAIVLDGMDVRDAMRASWRASGRRMRAAILVSLAVGLLSLPAATVASLLAPSNLDPVTLQPIPSSPSAILAATLVGGVLAALAVPVAGLALGILYRRLRLGDPGASPVPRPGAQRQRVAGVVVGIVALVGLVGYCALLGQTLDTGLQAGAGAAVGGSGVPGTITVGTGSPTRAGCRADGAASTFRAGQSIHWTADLRDPLGPAADTVVVLTRDGAPALRSPVAVDAPGSSCISGSDALTGLAPGSYRLEVYVDGGIEASGDFSVTP